MSNKTTYTGFGDGLFEETGLELTVVYSDEQDEPVGEYWTIGDAYSGGVQLDPNGYEVIQLSEYNPCKKNDLEE
jgi:hypothetical protein